MAEDKPISRFAQRFVARKLEEIRDAAYAGAVVQNEFENNFVDGVLELAGRIRRPDLHRHLMKEATKSSEYLRQVDESLNRAIRKIVWNGPWVETDEGRTIRGAVGQTHHGEYRSAEVSLDRDYELTGSVSGRSESSKWDDTTYKYKEQAIFAARETVQRSVERDRSPEQSSPPDRKSSAQKYGGGSEPIESELPPPRRSR
jgi:hypothetical protein